MHFNDRAPRPASYDERRKHILDAARSLFLAKSFNEISVRELERQSGYTRGAIYYYFADKEEIYLTIVLDDLTEVYGALTDAVARFDTPSRQLVAMIESYAGLYFERKAVFDTLVKFFFGDRPDDIRRQAQMVKADELLEQSIALVEAVIVAGNSAGSFDCREPRFAALSLWGMMVTVLQMTSDNPRLATVGLPREVLVQQIVEYHLHVVGAT